jgi:hypothetical protein
MSVRTGLASQAPVAHACNPSYLGGRDQENRKSKPAQAKSLKDLISKKKLKEWLKVQTEFKPQYCKKKKKVQQDTIIFFFFFKKRNLSFSFLLLKAIGTIRLSKAGGDKGGVRIGKTPRKPDSICCPQCRETKADTLKQLRPIGKGDQELEKRLDQKELT